MRNQYEDAFETRLRRVLHEVAEAASDGPLGTFAAAKGSLGVRSVPARSGRARLRLIVGTGVVLASALGTGVAAATGAFSAQANNVLREVTAGEPVTQPGASSGPRSTSPGSTATSSPPPTPSEEHRVLDVPGPDGSRLELWTYTEANGTVCHADVVTTPGKPVFPGAPPLPNDGACGGGGGGHPYRASSGALSMIIASSVMPGTAHVTIHFRDGVVAHPLVAKGWIALFAPYGAYVSGFTQTEHGSAGRVLQSFTSPPHNPVPASAPTPEGPSTPVTAAQERLKAEIVARCSTEPGVRRAAAKIVPYSDAVQPGAGPGGPNGPLPTPTYAIAVALGGRITDATLACGHQPLGHVPPDLPPVTWSSALLAFDADNGSLVVSSMGQSPWPAGFAALPSLQPGAPPPPRPRSVVLGPLEAGRTLTVVPGTRLEVLLPGSPVVRWSLRDEGPGHFPLMEMRDTAVAAGGVRSVWFAVSDGAQTIRASSYCSTPGAGACAGGRWWVRVVVRG